MGETELIGLIGNLGFPIAVAGYCLLTLNKTMGSVKASIDNNTRIISIICTKMNLEEQVK